MTGSKRSVPPRLLPDRPFPPYAYIPRRTPHPLRDPKGHSYGVAHAEPAAPDPDDWRACGDYLYGIDLFNYGYFWEAHEAWEGLWHACGRKGPTGLFLQALINLAAAGFQARRGNPRGLRANAKTALRLFRTAAGQIESGGRYMGLDVAALTEQAMTLSQTQESGIAVADDKEATGLNLSLLPQ